MERLLQRYNNGLKWFLVAILLTVSLLATSLNVSAAPEPPAPPTNLIDFTTRTIPATHSLRWNAPTTSSPIAYYRVYRDNSYVAQASGTSYQLNNSTHLSGSYTVRSVGQTTSLESGNSNAVNVTIGYLWVTNGSSWSSCKVPGAPVPAGPYDNCFVSGTSVYGLRNFNVKYNASAVRSGTAFIEVNYRQKFAALPPGYTTYNVNVIVGAGTSWQYVKTLQLPAAAAEVSKTYTAPITVPIDRPGEIEFQWVNDGAYNGGDANLQLDSISLYRG